MGLLIFSIILAIILRIYGPTIKGYFGEKSVSFFLSRLDPGKYKVINNIMLKIDGRTSQIDHVVVSNYGIFVIETKNYNGWILETSMMTTGPKSSIKGRKSSLIP
jgi:hypothetical protein